MTSGTLSYTQLYNEDWGETLRELSRAAAVGRHDLNHVLCHGDWAVFREFALGHVAVHTSVLRIDRAGFAVGVYRSEALGGSVALEAGGIVDGFVLTRVLMGVVAGDAG